MHDTTYARSITRALPAPNPAGRVPPNDADAEEEILAACLLSPDALDTVAPILRSEHFYLPRAAKIWGAIMTLHAEGQAVDVLSVAAWFRDRQALDTIGGAEELGRLADGVRAISDWATHATRLVEMADQRAIIAMCHRIAAEGYGDVGGRREWCLGAGPRLDAIALRDAQTDGVSAREALIEAFEELRDQDENGFRPWLSSGIAEYDAITGGFDRGNITVIGGRTGMGKSALGMQFALSVAGSKDSDGTRHGVLYFSPEMGAKELMKRAAASRANANFGKLRYGKKLTQDEWSRTTQAVTDLAPLPIIISSKSVSPFDIVARLRASKRGFVEMGAKCSLIVIDHLGLMSANGLVAANAREYDRISAITPLLKQIAVDEGLHIIELVQLNRGAAQRDNSPPTMTDLRGSGTIEQDANTIALIHRPGIGSEDDRVANLHIVKQRDGRLGKIELKWSGAFTRFDAVSGIRRFN